MIVIHIHFAVAVVLQKTLEASREVRKLLQHAAIDDFAASSFGQRLGEGGETAGELRQLVEFAIDHGRLGFATREQTIHHDQRLFRSGAHGDQCMEEFVQKRLRHRNGDIRLKVVRRNLQSFKHVPPDFRQGQVVERFGS